MTPSKEQLAHQLAGIRSNGLIDLLTVAAAKANIGLSYYVAIASRETNCENILGDWRNRQYHGVGLTQIDVQHDIARDARDDGSWKTNPQPLLDFGAELLATNLQYVRDRTHGLDGRTIAMIAAAGYNCGIKVALAEFSEHGNPDRRTTGKDYGADVMAREAIFTELLG